MSILALLLVQGMTDPSFSSIYTSRAMRYKILIVGSALLGTRCSEVAWLVKNSPRATNGSKLESLVI